MFEELDWRSVVAGGALRPARIAGTDRTVDGGGSLGAGAHGTSPEQRS